MYVGVEKLKYVGTYKLNNGQFFELYQDDNNNLFDQNGFAIEQYELRQYTKID